MKFKFNPNVSRIYDYLLFPRVYYFQDEKDEEDLLEEVIDDQYLAFVEEMNEVLAPFATEIDQFYQKGVYAQYEFCNILLHAFKIYDYQSEHQYLNDLMQMDEVVFRDEIIKSLLSMETELKEAELNQSNAIKYINALKIDPANKWNLLMMVQNPKDHLQNFINLLHKIQPYFDQYYQKTLPVMMSTGERLSKMLASKNTNEVFRKITKNSIDYDFSGFDECLIYISSVFPYTLRFFSSDDCRFVWGMYMEKSFEKIQELHENKMIQRVKIFKSLGDQTRYETLRLLAQGITSIKDIANQLDVSSATISYHINEFLTSGVIIISREKNKKAGYIVDHHRIEEVIENLKKDLNFPKK
jgi:DNA-binding transcriptional ArsR family regulator